MREYLMKQIDDVSKSIEIARSLLLSCEKEEMEEEAKKWRAVVSERIYFKLVLQELLEILDNV